MEIEKTEHHDIVTGEGAGLTSFFLPGELDRAFKENEWTLSEMVEILTGIARECSTKVITKKDGTIIEEPVITARERMAAISMLEKKAKENMVLGGLIQKDQLQVRKTLPDGSTAEFNAAAMRLTQEGSSRLQSTLALLEQAKDSKKSNVIDVEEIENDHDTGTGSNVCPGGGKSTGPGSGGTDRESGSRNGPGESSPVYGEQRPPLRDPFGPGKDHDNAGIQGAGNEGEDGITVERERGGEGSDVGEQGGEDRDGDQSNPESPDEPWWSDSYPEPDPGSPRPSGSPSDAHERGTESAADTAARVAAAAQNRYLEKRKKGAHSHHSTTGS